MILPPLPLLPLLLLLPLLSLLPIALTLTLLLNPALTAAARQDLSKKKRKDHDALRRELEKQVLGRDLPWAGCS